MSERPAGETTANSDPQAWMDAEAVESAKRQLKRLSINGRLPEVVAESYTQTVAERHPDWPPVNVTVDLAAHETVLDQVKSADRIRKAHIVCIENAEPDGRDEAIRQLNFLSSIDPSQHDPDYIDQLIAEEGEKDGEPVTGVREQFRRMIYGSGTIVASTDLRRGDPVTATEIVTAHELPYDASYGSMDEMLEKHDQQGLQVAAAKQRERERLMPDRLEEEVDRNMTDELRKLPEVDVLILMGAMHDDLPEQFEGAGFKNVRAVHDQAGMNSYHSELIRMHMRGQKPTREDMARGFLESIIGAGLDAMVPSSGAPVRTNDKIAYVRDVVSAFTVDEIGAWAWPTFHRNGGRYGLSFVERLLEAKNLGPLPRSVTELESLASVCFILSI